MKIARNVQFEIKAGQGKEFNRVMHADVLPLLKKQAGFSEKSFDACLSDQKMLEAIQAEQKRAVDKFADA